MPQYDTCSMILCWMYLAHCSTSKLFSMFMHALNHRILCNSVMHHVSHSEVLPSPEPLSLHTLTKSDSYNKEYLVLSLYLIFNRLSACVLKCHLFKMLLHESGQLFGQALASFRLYKCTLPLT